MFPLPELVYDRNNVRDVLGGGSYSPFMRRAGDISSGNQQALKDLLEAGIIQKVYYRPNSMGLDNLLAPYIESGIAELVKGPESVLIDNQFNLDGVVQDNNWRLDITYPSVGHPAGDGLQNVYKVELKARNGSFVFALPKEYQFNLKEYRYLKFKIYTPAKNAFTGAYAPYQRLWPRVMNRMWSFADNSAFGQELWNMDHIWIADDDLAKWTDITIDLNAAANRHNRVIVLNIGGEPSVSPFEPPVPLIYYFANLRFEM